MPDDRPRAVDPTANALRIAVVPAAFALALGGAPLPATRAITVGAVGLFMLVPVVDRVADVIEAALGRRLFSAAVVE